MFIVICLDSLPHRHSQDFAVHGGKMHGKLIQTFYVGGRLIWYIKHVFRFRDMNKNSLS